MCNFWCISFAEKLSPYLPQGASILEVGSRTVNGEIRNVFHSCNPQYVGVDIVDGDGVDIILDACSLSGRFPMEHFDAVVTTEMLEHCQDWRTGVIEMMKVLKINGYLLVTTRSPGFDLHAYPHDHFRFSKDDMIRIFEKAGTIIEIQDDMTLNYPCGIGVLVKRTITASEFDTWVNHLSNIEVTDATSIIFGDRKDLTPSEREELIFMYYMDLVSRREEEIIRLQGLLQEQTEWALSSVEEVKKRDKEIIRLQNMINNGSLAGQE